MAGDAIVELNDDTFDEKIREAAGPVLVDFWASWCGPCRAIAPALDEIAREMSGRAVVAKVDVDENGDLANRFGVRSIPTLLVFKDGKMVDQHVGSAPKDRLRELLLKHVG